jgi:DivIVA domain-containing protein
VPTGYPKRGLDFGGNNVRPIRWWPWFVVAVIASLAFGCSLGTTIGGIAGALAGTLLGAAIGLLTLMHPLRLRDYRFPEPPALRVAPDGLHVHLAEHGRWRLGSYLHLPWPAIAELTLIDGPLHPLTSPSLLIRLTLAGRTTIAQPSTAAQRATDAEGDLIVPQIATTELLYALTHYSGGRFASLQHEPRHPRQARQLPRLDDQSTDRFTAYHQVSALTQPPSSAAERDLGSCGRPGRCPAPIDVDFTVVLRGYDIAAVDGVVQRAHDALASGSPAARAAAREELRQIAFQVRFRGYNRMQVEEYLRRAAALLA